MSDKCSPDKIAAWLVNRVDRDAGEAITHLKLQKLIYFAQAYYLANLGEELFSEDFEAWAHGPVLPSIYASYSGNRWNALPTVNAPDIADEITNYLEAFFRKFGRLGAKELEKLSHSHSPWKDARGDAPPEARCSNTITKKAIKKFYGSQIKKAKKEK